MLKWYDVMWDAINVSYLHEDWKHFLKNPCKYIYLCKDIQMFLKQKTLIHSYMKLICEQDCNATLI